MKGSGFFMPSLPASVLKNTLSVGSADSFAGSGSEFRRFRRQGVKTFQVVRLAAVSVKEHQLRLHGETGLPSPARFHQHKTRGAPGARADQAQALGLQPLVCEGRKQLRQALRPMPVCSSQPAAAQTSSSVHSSSPRAAARSASAGRGPLPAGK